MPKAQEQVQQTTSSTWWYEHSCNCNICSDLWQITKSDNAVANHQVHKMSILALPFTNNAYSIHILVMLDTSTNHA